MGCRRDEKRIQIVAISSSEAAYIKWKNNNMMMNFRSMCSDDGTRMKLVQDRVQWRASVLVVLELQVLPDLCASLSKDPPTRTSR
jgi:hypothetical protein